MNLLNLDWTELISLSARWDGLSEDASDALLGNVHGRADLSAQLKGHVPELLEAGFLTKYADGRRVRLGGEHLAFANTVRLLLFRNVLEETDSEDIWGYLKDYFTHRHRRVFCPEAYNQYVACDRLAAQVISAQWVEGFLKADTVQSRLPHGTNKIPSFENPAAFKTLKMVVRKFMTFSEPVALKDLAETFKTLGVQQLGTAIQGAVGAFLLFPGIDPDGRTPIISLYPAIVRRLQRPKPKKPKAVEPDETYHGAALMDDMTAVMVTISARPVRIRANDGELFAKARKEIEASLLPLPIWLDKFIDSSLEKRVESALYVLRAIKFVENVGESGTNRSVRATDSAAKWLTADAKTRLKVLLDHIRPTKGEKSPAGAVGSDPGGGYREWDDYSPGPSFRLVSRTVEVRGVSGWDQSDEFAKTFKTLTGKRFVNLAEFLAWHCQVANPLLQIPPGETSFANVGWSSRDSSAERMESIWENAILDMLFSRLIPLGGAKIGYRGDQLSVSLTDAGRYVLGLADDFDYGHEHDADRAVVVQPNFDVVFMSPSPPAEASLARFAQRQGHGLGALFKITKQSIMTAAAAGISATDVIETLASICTKRVPANVTREIKGWFDQCRRVTVVRTMLVRCPDRETAAQVVSAAGKRATAITDTLVELEEDKTNAALFRKLDGMGIFCDLPEPPAAKRRKKRRRKSYW